MASHAAIIDPLAMLLPTSVYLALMEKLHPNEPILREVMAKMTAAEKAETLALANVMAAAAEAVRKAASAGR
jgi:hypothetical protein